MGSGWYVIGTTVVVSDVCDIDDDGIGFAVGTFEIIVLLKATDVILMPTGLFTFPTDVGIDIESDVDVFEEVGGDVFDLVIDEDEIAGEGL